jgi:hypothetical protein
MIELPDKIVRATHRNPRTMLFYTKPKLGKTTALSGLDSLMLIDTEKGSDYIDAYKVQVSNFTELREVAGKIYKKGYNAETKTYIPPYKYLALDTLT